MRASPLSLQTFLAAVAWLNAGPAASSAEPNEGQPRLSDRIVHRFDFDERESGNLESVPKYWEPLRPSGFPGFSEGGFDFTVGRLAPPSFHLASEGRNVAYSYAGPATAVQRGAEYRIEGYIRPDRLEHARACLSACFLNRRGEPILDSLRRTSYVGGPGQPDQWVRVEIYLPSAPAGAATIAVAGWVLQASTWDESARVRRHIARVDVLGGAWLDDITVYRLPRIDLSTSVPGNAIGPDDPPELRVVVTDHDHARLSGEVSIFAADGEEVETHPISVVGEVTAAGLRIPLEGLLPGLYTSRLVMTGDGTPIVTRTLTFARLAPPLRDSEGLIRAFGVVIAPDARSEPEAELALLRRQGVQSVKLPVWSSAAAEPGDAAGRSATDDLLRGLLKGGFAVIGVLGSPPAEIARRYGAYTRSVVDLLSDDPDAWREHLTAVAAPHASVYRSWQIGPDGALAVESASKVAKAAEQLRDALRPYMLSPRLGAAISTTDEHDAGKLPIEQITVAIGPELPTDRFPEPIQKLNALGYDGVSVYIEPLSAGDYTRFGRLASWGQRLIAARHAGADTVFAPQTWQVRDSEHGRITEPTEEFVILRTIADALAYAEPGPEVPVGVAGVRCLAFYLPNTAVVAMWDESAPAEGSRRPIQLGRATRQIDLWGRSRTLERDDHGRQLVRLSPMPVLIDGVERWLIDFQTSLVLRPAHMEAGRELVRHTLESTYTGSRSVDGQGRLEVPQSWEVSPRSFDFHVLPGRRWSIPLEVRFSHREPAGVKELVARLTLEQESYYLEVPLSVELGLTDIDVWGMAFVDGGDLVLRHVVANHTSSDVHFRGSAAVPGRERQYRPLAGLHPGDTQSVEYRFRRGAALTGRRIILGLREMNDGPRMHNLELIVP